MAHFSDLSGSTGQRDFASISDLFWDTINSIRIIADTWRILNKLQHSAL